MSKLIQIDFYWPLLLIPAVTTVVRKRRLGGLFCIILFGLYIGLLRGSMVVRNVYIYKNYYTKNVTFNARVYEDSINADKGQIEFLVDNITVQSLEGDIDLIGKVRVRGYGAYVLHRGDIVQVKGKLMPSISGSKQANISFAQISLLSQNTTPLDTVRRKFISSTISALPEPQASFALGLLIGQRSTLPAQTSEELSTVGLTHIVAVSGYNLTIIASFIIQLCSNRSKYQLIFLVGIFIGIFMIITGFSPSIVRAAWVSGVGLLAWYYGRTIKPLVLVSVTAAITAFLQPLYVFGDLGWYLSVLAFFGVLYVAPLFSRILCKTQKDRLTTLLLECLGAQIMTLPLILYIFGKLAVYGLLANILIVPFVPLAMLLSLVAGISFAISAAIFGVLALPATYVLTFMLDLVQILSDLPGSLVKTKISGYTMTTYYCVLILLFFVVHQTISRRERVKLLESRGDKQRTKRCQDTVNGQQ